MAIRLSRAIRAAAAKEARRAGQNALARRAGIDRAAMSRFLNGTGGLSLAGLDRLAGALGLAVCERGRRRGSKKGG